jgi:hypothetical protein
MYVAITRRTCSFRALFASRATIVAENLALRHQIGVLVNAG